MKKVFLALALVAVTVVSCKKVEAPASVDSVDSLAVDTVQVDSAAVDSVAVGTVGANAPQVIQ